MADKPLNSSVFVPKNCSADISGHLGSPTTGSENNPAPSDLCIKCGRRLVKDEIALTRKLINRGASSFWCLNCLAEHFEVSEDTLKAKIAEFREMGCTLFEPLQNDSAD